MKSKNMLEANWGTGEEMRKKLFLSKNFWVQNQMKEMICSETYPKKISCL